MESIIYNIAVWTIPVLFAITLHEVAHGWVADKLGDGTARMLGRLTVNPFKHIDPVGTVVVPLAMVLLQTGFVFGWAKPVPINTRNLKNPAKDMAIVAVAGPLSNLMMAMFWAIVVKLGTLMAHDLQNVSGVALGVIQMGMAGILINLVLFIFNLIPVPPLDGGRVLAGIVPASVSDMLDAIEPYGIFIVLGLVYFRILDITPLLKSLNDSILSFVL